jgi:hypothetical protein
MRRVLIFLHSLTASAFSLEYAAPGRVVAIGDVHGDYPAFVRTLRNARLVDGNERWIGGDATLVQLGDLLDRGANEAECWSLLRRLQADAPRAGGGRVIRLLGNHEVMNVCAIASNFIHPAGHGAFGTDRLLAFAPGGAIATEMADCCTVAAIIGDSCFVHAHLPADATRESLETLNQATQRWLRGEPAQPEDDVICTLVEVDGFQGSGRPQYSAATCLPLALSHMAERDKSPIWGRLLSSPSGEQPSHEHCDALRQSLARLGVSRLVVGHTPQRVINAACDGLVWRCDTGMSEFVMSGASQALEISQDGTVRVLDGDAAQSGGAARSREAAAANAGDCTYFDIF